MCSVVMRHQCGRSYPIADVVNDSTMTIVNLYGDFAGPKLRGNLLVKEPGNHQTHYLSLAPGQHLIPGSQGSLLRFYSTASGVTRKSLLNGPQQVFVFKWLGQKFHRS